MTPADLDALVARLRNSLGTNWPWTWNLAGEAAAALVQLRDSEALARGKIAEQMIEIARLKDLVTETCVKELAQMTRAHDAELRIAALEAERDALAKDAERLDWLDAHWDEAFVAKTEKGYLPWADDADYQTTLRAAIDAAKEKP